MTQFNPDRIVALRLFVSLTPAAFARKAGLKRQLIDQWESGETKPSADSLEALANAFGVDVGYFFSSRNNHDNKSSVVGAT
jgi:transcriptional regulator with XRE-family HTH domain